jgi:hypothetical protein
MAPGRVANHARPVDTSVLEPAMTTSVPVAALTFLAALLVVIGLFVAGNIVLIGLGIAGLIAAALIQALSSRRA